MPIAHVLLHLTILDLYIVHSRVGILIVDIFGPVFEQNVLRCWISAII